MKKNIAILYDNISGNTGDVAIGLSLRKILRKLNIDFDELVPGNYNPGIYDTIIIGGGHLLRENSDFYYDKFKIMGNNILNSMGIVGLPTDLAYLNQYRYLTFRSSGDKAKVNYLKKKSFVVPCTTMLLEDLNESFMKIEKESIGIHFIPNVFSKDEEKIFVNWVSNLPYKAYFIPITHYNKDYNYMYELSKKIKNAQILPIMTPIEIFTLMGKFKYVITCSLHGAIFAYIHNTPFTLMDQEKSRFFLEDRGLEKYLFRSLEDIIKLTNEMLNYSIDYSDLIVKDKKTLCNHIKNIEDNIPKDITIIKKNYKISDKTFQQNHQIHFLQSKICELYLNKDILKNNISSLKSELENKQSKVNDLKMQNGNYKNELIKIYKSKGWRFLVIMYNFKNKIKKIKTKVFFKLK